MKKSDSWSILEAGGIWAIAHPQPSPPCVPYTFWKGSWIHEPISLLHWQVIPLSLTPSQQVLKEAWALLVLLIQRETATNNNKENRNFSLPFSFRSRSEGIFQRAELSQYRYNTQFQGFPVFSKAKALACDMYTCQQLYIHPCGPESDLTTPQFVTGITIDFS